MSGGASPPRPPLCCELALYPQCGVVARCYPDGRRPMRAAHRIAEPPYSHAPQGICRLDGAPILKPDGTPHRARRWHELCTTWWDITVHREITIRAWRLVNSPMERRESVAGPRGGKQYEYGCWTHVRLSGLVPCASCGRPLWPGEIEVDHIVELVDGGEHAFANLQPLCHRCHAAKSAAARRARARGRAGRQVADWQASADRQLPLELPA